MVGLPPLFDATKYIGTGFPEHPDFPTAADLLAHLDRLGIDRAVVWHTEARGPHPMAGNEQLIREIAAAGAQDRVIPSFAIAPSMIDERGAMDRFLDLVNAHGVRAFRVWPGESGWSLRDIAPILQTLLPLKPVLFLDVWQDVKKEEVLSFAAEFPQTPTIFTNPMWVHYPVLWTAPLGLDRMGRDVALSDEAGKREPHHGSETKIQCGLQAAGGGGGAGRRGQHGADVPAL